MVRRACGRGGRAGPALPALLLFLKIRLCARLSSPGRAASAGIRHEQSSAERTETGGRARGPARQARPPVAAGALLPAPVSPRTPQKLFVLVRQRCLSHSEHEFPTYWAHTSRVNGCFHAPVWNKVATLLNLTQVSGTEVCLAQPWEQPNTTELFKGQNKSRMSNRQRERGISLEKGNTTQNANTTQNTNTKLIQNTFLVCISLNICQYFCPLHWV